MSVPTITDHRVAISQITADGNVRDLDTAHVDALAGSIAVIGLLSPLTVRADGERFQLVAGFHRHAACRKLGMEDVPVTLRDAESSSADRAAENVVRKELSPLEEARAVQAMLDEGFTLDGTARVLGWSRKLVGNRARILELPDAAQRLIGSREIPVGAVDALLRINAVAPPLGEAVAQAVSEGEVAGSQLANNVGWALGRALTHTGAKTFAAYLSQVHGSDVESLRLGKKTETLLAEAETLHKQLDRHAYGPPQIRFAEADIDQARAARVLIEIEGTSPIICDRSLYRELCKQAIARTANELRDRKARQASEQSQLRTANAKRPKTPKEQLDVEHRAALRELTRRAHNVNLDLGNAMLNELCVVDPASMDVARFFAYGLLGPDRRDHLGTSDNVARVLAANGLRIVLEDLRTTTTPTLKSGQPGKTKIAYAEVDEAQERLWRYVDGAKTAGELYGRAMVVFAAQHYAQQLVLPNSQRRSSILPSSRNDIARKAFERIAKKVLPATHKQLARELEREATAYLQAKHDLERPTPSTDSGEKGTEQPEDDS